jgi:protein TonB
VSEPALNQSVPEAPAGLVPSAGAARAPETLLLLTHDDLLIQALAGVVAPGSLTVVADEADLGGQLMSGQAGVVFIDAGEGAEQAARTAQLTQRLHSEAPDVVLVVAGDGAAQSELAALITDGVIYRFVHKPVSAQRVKLFVDAAWRKRDGTSSGASGLFPALSMSQTLPILPMPRPIPWLGITAAVAIVAVAALWYLLHPAPVTPTTTTPAALAAPATTATDIAPAPQGQTVPSATQEVLVTAPRRPAARMRVAPPLLRLRVPAPVPVPVDVPVPAAITLPTVSPGVAAAARMRSAPPLATLQVPAPAPIPVTVTAPPPVTLPKLSPVVAATPATLTDRVSGVSGGQPTSTPPVSEAKDPLSVAAVILERVYWVDPEFPEIAREQDLTGFVDLEFMVHADGSVTDVTVLKAQPADVFEKTAVAAVRQWRYRPVERDGVPVDEHARLRLNFGYK